MNTVDVVAHCSNMKYRPKNEKAKEKINKILKTHKNMNTFIPVIIVANNKLTTIRSTYVSA